MARDVDEADGALERFRRWFWQPPRAHGEIIEDRSVSFLELFYDLVYVVVVSRAAHQLAAHLSVQGVAEFAIIFGLVWNAWVNGTQFYDLHGREDGRTRSFVFLQMGILALLAVFTGEAASESGMAFALVYVAYLAVLTWLWYSVRRRDRPEYKVVSGRYLVGMLVSVFVIGLSAFLPDTPRLVLWATFVVAWILGISWLGTRPRTDQGRGIFATESMVERFDLFTIIVLGEVVVGVVDGLTQVGHDLLTVTTGMLELAIGFGLWWIFFDFVGRRLPRDEPPALTAWMLSHLPTTLAIAAAGAAMVGLIEHAHDARTPAVTAWLLGGSVAVALLAEVMTARTLVDDERLAIVYRPLLSLMTGGAVAVLAVAWWQPAPWLLALSLVAILSAIWFAAVARWLSDSAPGQRPPRL